MDNPIAGSVAAQARLALAAHPDITVIFAPYDEFARGVKMAVRREALIADQDLLGRYFHSGYRRDARARE